MKKLAAFDVRALQNFKAYVFHKTVSSFAFALRHDSLSSCVKSYTNAVEKFSALIDNVMMKNSLAEKGALEKARLELDAAYFALVSKVNDEASFFDESGSMKFIAGVNELIKKTARP